MLNKILLITTLSALSTIGFATSQGISTMANEISIKAAVVDPVNMGPLGQSNPTQNQLSTEVKMDIINHGKQNAVLVAATSPVAKQVQLHTFVKKDGKSVMKPIQSISIKAHTADDLSFQGIHVMLIGLQSSIVKDHILPLTLIFADGSHLSIKAVLS